MKEQQKKQKKRKSVLKKILIFLGIVILIILSAVGGFIAYSTYKNGWGMKGMLSTIVGQDEEKLKDLDRIDVLILGVSKDISVDLTDTIIIASYDPKTQSASMMSIPRDTFVGKSQQHADSYNKINCLYQKGVNKTIEAVNSLTGMNIQYYLVVDTTALVKLVDTIGGVEFDVPIDMIYDDDSQGLHINLQKGMQKLDGKKAEHLVRFRKNNNGTTYPLEYGDNDTGRMRTQREFLIEVLKQTISFKNIFKIKEMLDITYKYVDTNISLDVAKDYVPYIVEFDTSTLRTETLPGVNDKLNNLWFFIPNKKEINNLVAELYPPEIEENNEREISSNNLKNAKVEILNGTEDEEKLTKLKNDLIKNGYSVDKAIKTTETAKTMIINKKNKSEEDENELKNILGVDNISKSTNSSSAVDFTIIIGKDYN